MLQKERKRISRNILIRSTFSENNKDRYPLSMIRSHSQHCPSSEFVMFTDRHGIIIDEVKEELQRYLHIDHKLRTSKIPPESTYNTEEAQESSVSTDASSSNKLEKFLVLIRDERLHLQAWLSISLPRRLILHTNYCC